MDGGRLSLLYSKTIGLIFKGGTCLRIAYSSPRYSEDLDFNSNLDEDKAYKTLNTAVKELEYFGIRAQIRNKRMSRSGFGFALSYMGPLYEGRDITKGMVRIDVSLRGENVSEERVMVRTEYDDVKTFVISAASLDHIFAEKVRALLVRGMARDLYDRLFHAKLRHRRRLTGVWGRNPSAISLMLTKSVKYFGKASQEIILTDSFFCINNLRSRRIYNSIIWAILFPQKTH